MCGKVEASVDHSDCGAAGRLSCQEHGKFLLTSKEMWLWARGSGSLVWCHKNLSICVVLPCFIFVVLFSPLSKSTVNETKREPVKQRGLPHPCCFTCMYGNGLYSILLINLKFPPAASHMRQKLDLMA